MLLPLILTYTLSQFLQLSTVYKYVEFVESWLQGHLHNLAECKSISVVSAMEVKIEDVQNIHLSSSVISYKRVGMVM